MNLYDGSKDKLQQIGVESLTNEELVKAFLICQGLSQELLKLNESFWDVIGDIAGYGILNQLEKETIFNENKNASLSLEAAVELGKRMQTQPIQLIGKVIGSAQIGKMMITRFQKNTQEHLLLLCLDTKNQIKREVIIFKGGLNSAKVHPREIMVEALRVSSNSFILVHNHPSGNIEPSMNDVAFTKKMQKVGELMGIRLIDHLIIGDQRYWSAAEKGVLND